jgi:hypothetical protein
LELAKYMHPTDATVFRESFVRGFEEVSYTAVYDWFNAPEDDGLLIPKEDFNESYSRPGFNWHERMTVTQAQIGAERADSDYRYELLTSHASYDWSAMLARAGGSLAPQFLDPVNYLPLAGYLGKAAFLSRRLSKAVALGAEGAVIESARQGLFYGRDQALGKTFDLSGAMLSIGMGMGIGSGYGMMLDQASSLRTGLRHLGNSWDQLIVQGKKAVKLGPDAEFPEAVIPESPNTGDILDDLNTQKAADDAVLSDTELSPQAKERYAALQSFGPRAIALMRGCMARLKGGK